MRERRGEMSYGEEVEEKGEREKRGDEVRGRDIGEEKEKG